MGTYTFALGLRPQLRLSMSLFALSPVPFCYFLYNAWKFSFRTLSENKSRKVFPHKQNRDNNMVISPNSNRHVFFFHKTPAGIKRILTISHISFNATIGIWFIQNPHTPALRSMFPANEAKTIFSKNFIRIPAPFSPGHSAISLYSMA